MSWSLQQATRLRFNHIICSPYRSVTRFSCLHAHPSVRKSHRRGNFNQPSIRISVHSLISLHGKSHTESDFTGCSFTTITFHQQSNHRRFPTAFTAHTLHPEQSVQTKIAADFVNSFYSSGPQCLEFPVKGVELVSYTAPSLMRLERRAKPGCVPH